MSFGGPIDSMINSNKQNLKELGKRRNLSEIQKDYKATQSKPLRFKKGTTQGLLQFQNHMRQSRKADRLRFVLIVGLTLIIVLIILMSIINADYSGIIEVIE